MTCEVQRMSVERDRFARSGWLVGVVVAVPLLGVVNAIGPQPFAALGFVANLTVLGVAGGRALLGRTGLSAVERATMALALPIGVLVLGTIATAALRLHLDRQLWAGLVALTAEAAAAGVLSRRGHPGGPRNLVGRVAGGGRSRTVRRGHPVRVDSGPPGLPCLQRPVRDTRCRRRTFGADRADQRGDRADPFHS